ncbi:MAG: fumarylacetoacetase [Caldimonas sp.]|uniref:fumarylacetoacetase n=1 Tax=Caldimonas taiwanensis TaxID=307483 RepID=UPI000783EA74|nr:fumarylacetoacetase [Caldimonas taiwanensis]GIX24304.1 MAG: fumarylacetoacetase [Caldimonas sp.]
MSSQLDETHDPALQSWVETANDASTDFPIQNLPLARFRRIGSQEPWRVGVAIGDQIVDLAAASRCGLLPAPVSAALAACEQGRLNALMAAGRSVRVALRRALSQGLRRGSAQQAALSSCLVPQAQAEYALPCRIEGYTDFYTGIHHATAVGRLFRPDNPLLPNYKWVPIAYHGRTSSIGVSGQRFHRPLGQLKPPTAAAPQLGPCQRLDYELELGVFIGPGNALGEPLSIEQAEDHAFGLVLLNDWSARDIQAWEYQPLGPFLSKNFATTISPWIVTMEALEPFRSAWSRPEGDPQPLPYLDSAHTRQRGAIDIHLEVWLQTARMREDGQPPERLMASNFRDAYWTVGQMIAHHSINGCNLQSGDLLGSGTQSGPGEDQGGSLLELTCGGKNPVRLTNGETRTFLEDGDTVVLRARCQREGWRSIGFSDCAGTVLPAVPHR